MKLVRTVRTVVPSPRFQTAVVTLIERTGLVVDLLTGVYRPRPATQKTGMRSYRMIPSLVRIFSPHTLLFFRQR